MSKLDRRHQLFVVEYLKHGNAYKAAKAAGYPESTARDQGTRIKNIPAVKAQLDESRKLLVAEGAYNLRQAMEEAGEAIDFARKTANANAYVKAVELRSKLNGLLIERQEIRTDSFQLVINKRISKPIEPKETIDVESTVEGEEDVFS